MDSAGPAQERLFVCSSVQHQANSSAVTDSSLLGVLRLLDSSPNLARQSLGRKIEKCDGLRLEIGWRREESERAGKGSVSSGLPSWLQRSPRFVTRYDMTMYLASRAIGLPNPTPRIIEE